MQWTHWSSVVVISLLVLLSNGCLYNNVREVEPDKPFEGLRHTYDMGGSALNVVFVHGMGDHPFGKPPLLKYQREIAKELGFNEEEIRNDLDWGSLCPEKSEGLAGLSVDERELVANREDADQAICPMKINQVIVGFIGWSQYRSGNADRTLNLFELSWDRATELLQKAILELDEDYEERVELDEDLKPSEGGRNREADRAPVNRWLKKFVNQKLGDPVIYLGRYGDSIRRVVAGGLSAIAEAGMADGEYVYSIVSDSLGSRVVFDALGCALGGSGTPSCEYLHPDPGFQEIELVGLKTLSARTTQVFMNANQLPLLALAHVRPPGETESKEQWLKRFPCEDGGPGLRGYPGKEKVLDGRVQIVAFTDPNDALSYHLTERFRKKCTHLGGREARPVDFINVRISNAKWNVLGLVANPDQAHSDGFRTNKQARRLLVEGYRPEPGREGGSQDSEP